MDRQPVWGPGGEMQQELRSFEVPTDPALREPRSQASGTSIDDIILTVHSDIAGLESIWRDLERSAPISIYQRYDWVQPWCRHAASSLLIEPAIVLGSRQGRPLFLLPLGRQHRKPGIEIGWLGCSHNNIGMGLFEPAFARSLDGETTRQLFDRIGAALAPADFLALRNQPYEWEGRENPLRHLSGRVGDQSVIAIPLAEDFASLLNARKRKKLRWQENALANVGGYRFFRAEDRDQAPAVFAEFLDQKEQQFAKLGIDNVFAGPGPSDFFGNMISRSVGMSDPVIELFGVEIDGKVRATFAGGVHEDRLYGYFSGITMDEYQRVSPGELLLYHLIRHCCEKGYKTLDLGVGEERYKSAWSPVREQHFSSYVPISLKGKALAPSFRLMHHLKLTVRENETAWKVAKRLRRWKAALLPHRSSAR